MEKVNYDMDYSAEYLHRLICNKRCLIDLKDQGSYRAAETLLDVNILEERYLTHNQRTVIYYICERGYGVKKTAQLLGTNKDKIFEIMDSILPTLQQQMVSDCV